MKESGNGFAARREASTNAMRTLYTAGWGLPA
ncbi:hypothetical protein POHY109586_00810 [Polaromonas hydrogenivorans]